MRPDLTKEQPRAFTLVELLIAMTILSLLVVLIASLLSGVSRAWVSGEQQVQTFQDGRAIVELISRELSQAVMSPSLQLIQNPLLPTGVTQRANSDSLFWQAPLTSTPKGNICEVGYYLTDSFQLRRFFVPPDNANYSIFTTPPTATAAPWITTTFSTSAQFNGVSFIVADGVIAFWIRCMDVNGNPVPWFSARSPQAPVGTTIRYNSAARFQPALSGQAPPTTASWPYTAAATLQANRLPVAIEITVVTLDTKSFQRNPTIPAIPSSTSPDQVPAAVTTFNQLLVAARVSSARTFSTRVNLTNGLQ